jgi:glucose/arabinose dehydrogenase
METPVFEFFCFARTSKWAILSNKYNGFIMSKLITAVFLFLSGIALAQYPAGFAAVQVAGGLDPTGMAAAPDGRLFLLEKSGRVLIIRDGVLLPDPFLTLDVDNYNERGLTGIAFDPDFDFNHYVYVFYTIPGANRNRVSRFIANGDYAIPGSEQVLLETDPLAGTIHNAGGLLFGPDKKLYIATGDGADAGTAQRLNSLLGKVLRINSDGSIPTDNPYYNQATGPFRSIWALGFRNPFSFAIQPGTGRMIVGDVGGDQFEELNLIERGGNYGWPLIEGPRSWQSPPANYTDPLYAYSHNLGCSVIGAAFYNPATATFPQRYHGKFFFADYCDSYIKVLNPQTGLVEETFATATNRPVALQVTPDGSLYVLSRAGMGGGSVQDNTSSNNGALWRVFYTGSGAPFIYLHPESVTIPLGEPVEFRVAALGQAPLSYQWLQNQVPIPGATQPTFSMPAVLMADNGAEFSCRVSNNLGSALSQPAILSVTNNQRPLPLIALPTTNARYAAGDTIYFAGTATDPEDGVLPADELVWHIDLHHDDHTHPALQQTLGADGFFIVPRVGETSDNVWYRIHLTATDAGGLNKTVSRDVLPETTSFLVQSVPAGLPLNVDGKNLTTPAQVISVKGILRVVSAQPYITSGNTTYRFVRWSDGWEDAVYPFFAGDQASVTAIYEALDFAIGRGTGLQGQYFERTVAQGFDGQPVLSRLDSVIDFDWYLGSPDPARIRADNFLVRWEGDFLAPISGPFQFFASTDDGVRLWINNELIIDAWVPRADTESGGTINLEKGKLYPIKMEYFEAGGHAVARLRYSATGIPKQIIPKTQLYPTEWPDPGQRYALFAYPVPANEEVTIKINTWQPELVPFSVFDMSGKTILRGQWSVLPGSNRFPIIVSGWPAGVYQLRLEGKIIKDTLQLIRS